MNSSRLPETSDGHQGPLMYLVVEQEKCEGDVNNSCLPGKSYFIEVGSRCCFSSLRLEQGNWTKFEEKEAGCSSV